MDSSVEVKVTGGTIDNGHLCVPDQVPTIGAADGTGPSVTAGAAVFSGRHNPDNTILGGAFDAPAVAVLDERRGCGREGKRRALSVSGGSYTASPLAFADPDAAVLGLSSGGGTAYYVGADVAAGAAASGDHDRHSAGRRCAHRHSGDVTVSNSGTGSVTANGGDVPAGGSVTIETFTVVYKTNAGMVRRCGIYGGRPIERLPRHKQSLQPTSRAFMLLAAQKGDLYVPSNGEMVRRRGIHAGRGIS